MLIKIQHTSQNWGDCFQCVSHIWHGYVERHYTIIWMKSNFVNAFFYWFSHIFMASYLSSRIKKRFIGKFETDLLWHFRMTVYRILLKSHGKIWYSLVLQESQSLKYHQKWCSQILYFSNKWNPALNIGNLHKIIFKSCNKWQNPTPWIKRFFCIHKT